MDSTSLYIRTALTKVYDIISSLLVCDMQMPFHCVFNHGVSKSHEKVCGEGMLPSFFAQHLVPWIYM